MVHHLHKLRTCRCAEAIRKLHASVKMTKRHDGAYDNDIFGRIRQCETGCRESIVPIDIDAQCLIVKDGAGNVFTYLKK